jgi:hypothetical protein
VRFEHRASRLATQTGQRRAATTDVRDGCAQLPQTKERNSHGRTGSVRREFSGRRTCRAVTREAYRWLELLGERKRVRWILYETKCNCGLERVT